MPCPETVAAVVAVEGPESPGTAMGTCTAEWLRQALEAGHGVLTLDCRAPNDYNTSHIVNAIHVAIPALMLRRLAKKGSLSVASVIQCAESKERFNKKWKTEPLIVYDEDTLDSNVNNNSVVALIIRSLRKEGCRVSLLQGKILGFSPPPHHMYVGPMGPTLTPHLPTDTVWCLPVYRASADKH